MIFTISKYSLISSTTMLAILAQIPIDEGKRLADLGVAGILGVVAIASILGLIYVYKVQLAKDEKNNEKLYELIEESTRSMALHSETFQNQKEVLLEIKDAIRNSKR